MIGEAVVGVTGMLRMCVRFPRIPRHTMVTRRIVVAVRVLPGVLWLHRSPLPHFFKPLFRLFLLPLHAL
jgi:hypothetical protein